MVRSLARELRKKYCRACEVNSISTRGTGNFNLDFPDLNREAFPFRSIRFQGTVQGMTLVNDQLVIQSSLYNVSGEGKIDLEHQQIDARGLVTVQLPGSRIIRRIPLVGSIFGIG